MKKVVQKLGFMAVGAACCAALLAPTSASAGSVTELKFLQTLAQLTGDAGILDERLFDVTLAERRAGLA